MLVPLVQIIIIQDREVHCTNLGEYSFNIDPILQDTDPFRHIPISILVQYIANSALALLN